MMLRVIFLVLYIGIGVIGFSQIPAHVKTSTPFTMGETLIIESEVLDEERLLNVYLPPTYYYADSTTTFPVIYLLDGSYDEDFIHIAGLVQFGNFPWVNLLPESIVVGIANVDRKKDFTYPTNNEQDLIDFPTTGHSKEFIQYLNEEVIPIIEDIYPTDTIKTIMGQSLGGLLAAEILLDYSDMFDNYVVISPSLWWDDESILEKKIGAIDSSKNIYIAVGKEGEVMERVAKTFHDNLNSSDNVKARMYFQYFEKHDHGDILHQAAYDAFEKIFKSEE